MQQKYCTAQKCHETATAKKRQGWGYSFPASIFGLAGSGSEFA
jgi:hypothetical protein